MMRDAFGIIGSLHTAPVLVCRMKLPPTNHRPASVDNRHIDQSLTNARLESRRDPCAHASFDDRYMAAKAVFRERKQVWEGINPSFLSKPPRERDEEQARQYRLWKRRLAYEKGNPEVGDHGDGEAEVGRCLSV